MANISLKSILNSDSDLSSRIAKKAKNVQKDKENLLKSAKECNDKHIEEIKEGTKQRRLLLEAGKAKGLRDDEIFKHNEIFLLNENTPILNYLYYIVNDIDVELKILTEKYNKEFGTLEHKDVLSENTRSPKPMEEMLYNGISLETFNKLKKLKTMSRGTTNENEAFHAFKKLNELCQKYNLDPDRIPLSQVRDDID